MRTIAIIGAGESGIQLALGLQKHGYPVTVFSDRGPEAIRSGSVMSSQCMFSSALAVEEDWTQLGLGGAVGGSDGLDQAGRIGDSGIPITGMSIAVAGDEPIRWAADLDAPARSVDQRVKCSAWIDLFVSRGGDFRVETVTAARLDELAASFELVVVSTGKGQLGQVFSRDKTRSPITQPQRALALTYVTGTQPDPAGQLDDDGAIDSRIRMNIKPGVGEFFTFPGLTTSGPCQMMVFEGVRGGPMDCWTDVTTPADHLARSLDILRENFPDEAARFEGAELTDDGAVLRGLITPTVRHAVGTLPSGRVVFGLGDAVVLNDPLTGQGSNNAALASQYYEDAIVRRGADAFDADWMRRTFDEFWRGWAQWSVSWTNSMLKPLKPHQLGLLERAQTSPALAAAIVNGFDDPREFFPWWYDEAEAETFTEVMAAEEESAFDLRDFRSALGQFATGVTVITTRGRDGRRVGLTANSFTSVSMDPPMVLWCPSNRTPSLQDFEASTHFAINILASDQHVLSRQFATPSADKFVGVETSDGIGGIPLIDGALATFECRTVARHTAGDHDIYVGEVESYHSPGGQPLVFHSGKYHTTAVHPDF